MRKRTLWSVSAGLICILLGFAVLQAAGVTRSARVDDKSPTPVSLKASARKPAPQPAVAPVSAKPAAQVSTPAPAMEIPMEAKEAYARQWRGEELLPGDKQLIERFITESAPVSAPVRPNTLDDNGGQWFAWTGSQSITDNACATTLISMPVSVAGLGNVIDVQLTLTSVTMTYDGDLKIWLQGPTGIRRAMCLARGAGGDNFTNTIFSDSAATAIGSGTAPFTGTFRPDSSLDIFDGSPANGTWQVVMCDNASGDVATVASWQLQILASATGDPHNYGCSAITSPVNPTPGSTVPVTVTVSNWGTVTEAAPLKYSFAGGPLQSEMTGELAQNATESHSFATQITIPTIPGAYVLTVYTDLATDVSRINDTVRTTINVTPDECTLALPLVLVPNSSTVVNGNTTGSTVSCRDTCTMNNNYVSYGPDHFATFTLTECHRLAFALTGGDMHLVIYQAGDNCCGPILWCNDDISGFTPLPSWDIVAQHPTGTASYIAAEIPAGVYFVRIGYYGSSYGAYTLTAYDNGACPTVGRCCYGNPVTPSCAENSLAECQALNGSWLGGETCVSQPCPSRPANDECVNVTPVALPATFTGTVNNATHDCSLITAGNGEVWHAFTLTQPSNVTADYCNTNAAWTAFYTTLVSGCPCASLISSTSTNYTACANGNIQIFWRGLQPGTYYLPVEYSTASYDTGAYEVNVSAVAYVPPVNDNCSSVTPVALPATFTGNVNNATHDCSLYSYGDGEVWHAFTTNECMNVTVDYCGTDGSWTAFESILVNGCPCASSVSYTSTNYTACANGNITIQYNQLPAGTYYLPVEYSLSSYDTGAYAINVTGVVCPPPPANDLCANAIALSGDVAALPWDNSSAVAAAENSSCSMGHDIWYRWTTLCETDVNMTTCGTLFDTKLAVFNTSTCPGATDAALVCNDDTTCDTYNRPSAVSFHATAGTYMVQVGGFSSYTGAGFLNITTNTICSCDSATAVTLYADPNLAGHEWLHFNAPSTTGRYLVYQTTQKNNDGDPRNDDPAFTLAATLTATATGTQIWEDTSAIGLYKNFVVVHDCSPLGSCCYGDVMNPSCTVNTHAACDALTGLWTLNGDCSTPCATPHLARCCYGDPTAPSCATNAHFQCNALGGTWDSLMTCESDPCVARPVNDDCGGAIAVDIPGTYSGDNAAATGAITPATTCGSGGHFDVWYAYTATTTLNVTAATCLGADYDTILDVLTGTCGNLTSIGCSDDYTDCSPQSSVSFTTTVGTTYYIRVLSYYSTAGDQGPYTLTLTVQ